MDPQAGCGAGKTIQPALAARDRPPGPTADAVRATRDSLHAMITSRLTALEEILGACVED
jgi:hypothetical protein